MMWGAVCCLAAKTTASPFKHWYVPEARSRHTMINIICFLFEAKNEALCLILLWPQTGRQAID